MHLLYNYDDGCNICEFTPTANVKPTMVFQEGDHRLKDAWPGLQHKETCDPRM